MKDFYRFCNKMSGRRLLLNRGSLRFEMVILRAFGLRL
jgi:hypothetical protein